MTGSGWPPFDPTSPNPGQVNPGQANPGPWSTPSGYGPSPSGYAAPPSGPASPSSGPASPPSGYPVAGGYPAAGGYGQPGYPPPNTYPGGPGPVGGRRATRAPSATGIAVSTIGAALAVLGLFLSWYARGSAHAGVKELAQSAKLDGAPGFAHLYFGWALWVVLGVAIAVAISANLAGSAVVPLALGGALAGVVSTGLTFAALNSGRTSGSPLDNAAVGLWLFLLGPLILAAGALYALTRPAR